MQDSQHLDRRSIRGVQSSPAMKVKMIADPCTTQLDEATASMRSLVLSLAQAVVADESAVTVAASSEQNYVNLVLSVARSDLGKVIGKNGRTARSMRTILEAASMQLQRRFTLDIGAHRDDLAGPL
jgi:predicted RNA-binding protein YlqC (UPF0109 family)